VTAETVTFIVAAAIILIGALGVVAARNPVHSALFLVQTLMGVAVLFVVQDAHFLAAVQAIVYAGAIVILFLFVIMLLGVDKAEEWDVDEPIAGQQPLAAVIGAAVLGLTVVATVIATDVVTGARAPEAAGVADGVILERSLDNEFTDIERIGRVLFSDYALAFEITAALLTIAVVAAVVLTRPLRRDRLDDLEPASFDLPAPAPRGGNDSDLEGDDGADGYGAPAEVATGDAEDGA
jgi:NADH-quinone oxidoreductase subunit J